MRPKVPTQAEILEKANRLLPPGARALFEGKDIGDPTPRSGVTGQRLQLPSPLQISNTRAEDLQAYETYLANHNQTLENVLMASQQRFTSGQGQRSSRLSYR